MMVTTTPAFLANMPPGPVALPGTGRVCWWTGRVVIGLLYTPHPQRTGSHADMWQRLLTHPLPKQWEPTPRVIELKPSLRRRVARLLRGYK